MKPIFLVVGLLVLATLAGLGYANYGVIRDLQLSQALARSGVVVGARVLSAEEVNPGRSPAYRARLAFTPAGSTQAVTVERSVDFSTYRTLRDTRAAQVRYLPGQPQGAEVVGNANTGISAWLVGAVDLLVLGFVVWGVWTWRRGR